MCFKMLFCFLGMNLNQIQVNPRMDGFPWGSDGHGMQHNPSMTSQPGEFIINGLYLRKKNNCFKDVML